MMGVGEGHLFILGIMTMAWHFRIAAVCGVLASPSYVHHRAFQLAHHADGKSCGQVVEDTSISSNSPSDCEGFNKKVGDLLFVHRGVEEVSSVSKANPPEFCLLRQPSRATTAKALMKAQSITSLTKTAY